jgi:alpha-L-fucosidase
MKTKTIFALLFIVSLLFPRQFSLAQLPKETEAQKTIRMKWWTDARFGMFIHWGLYALSARHEWVKNNERLTNIRSTLNCLTPICMTPMSGPKWQKQPE